MRKISIVATLLLAILAVIATFHASRVTLYAQAGIVTHVDHAQDVVEVTTQNGHMWEFYGAEDWCVGDIAALLMNDMGTLEVTDDMIISVRYCGTAQAEGGN